MLSYFRQVWRCRYFWMSLVRMDLRTRYRRSVLGIGWSLLNPIFMTVILCAVFCPLMGVDPFQQGPYLLLGLACWQFLTTACQQGSQAFFLNEAYIRQNPLPLAIYPLRFVLGGMVHFLIALALVIAFVLVWPGGTDPGRLSLPEQALCLVPALAMVFVLAWSLAVLAGLSNVFFTDTQHLIDVGLQMLFYLTPIIYRAEMLRGREYGWLLDLNPVVVFLDLVRIPVLDGAVPPLMSWLHAGLVVAAAAGCAAWALGRLEKRLIFHL